ncbi:DUF4174 domain-containing protein [Gilvimarinus sp. DA14]|uniref:DUF4174 domain-containing protein n=1 Tax=Gilvimarinus sp. DA14 TaxID=2956798 RepID=UPI0020B86063|nr:DUF4174 domain-containing protein [Gilvimarinus sp. DA14]UTF61820.1 DUF4174 domain-containing protein [Gilvimarinus sp. DA14]
MKPWRLWLLTLLPFAATGYSAPLNDLAPLRWENRIILAWTDKPQAVVKALRRESAAVQERDIVWFVFSDGATQSNYSGKLSDDFATVMTEKYHRSTPQVLLIGKDGGVKDDESELLLKSLFQQIDAMPMRQREMQNGS